MACSAASLVAMTGYWIASGGYLPLVEGIRHQILDWTAKQGLGLRQILVSGRNHLSDADLQFALGLHQGMPLLGIDLEALRQRLLAAPWVRSVNVARHLPDQVIIEIEEAEPFALWQDGPKLFLIDNKGQAIGTVDRSQYPFLPVLAGTEAPQQAQPFFQLLMTDKDLFKRITAATYISQRRWNLRFDNGIEVKLPEDHLESAWTLLGQLQRQQKILDRAISGIDLRLPDKIFIETPATPLLQQNGSGDGDAI